MITDVEHLFMSVGHLYVLFREMSIQPVCTFFKRFYLFIFRKGGREKEREGNIDAERNIDQLPLTHTLLGTEPAAQSRALTRNRTGDLLVCGVTPNQLSHTGQGPLYIF